MAPRPYRNASRRSRSTAQLLGGLGLFALVCFGIIGTLWLAGVPLNPFAPKVAVEDPYMVRIPINGRPIPAYARVDRSHLLNPADGKMIYQPVPPNAVIGMSIVGIDRQGTPVQGRVDAVKNDNGSVVFVSGESEIAQANTQSLGGALINVNAIIGRVVKKDKRAGLGFKEENFFPEGTPEGLAGATPMGMRAITLDATLMTGVHSLHAGDRIDLLASIPTTQSMDTTEAGATAVEMLAQNAHVLRPVYVRNEVNKTSSLMQGESLQNVPKYEIALAVTADDVIPLQEALNQKLKITCVAHSMKPESTAEISPAISSSDEVEVPVTVRPILAYQVVSRDAFVSPATRTLRTERISRRQAEQRGAITSVSEALGAITRQDIPAGRFLCRGDLLKGPPEPAIRSDAPLEADGGRSQTHADGKRYVSMIQSPDTAAPPSATAVGDRPAITRFIPAGRTAFAIPLNRIYGAEHLQIGDSIDLLASYSLERLRDEQETETRPDGTVIVRKSESLEPRTTQRTWEESFGNRAEPWFVASNAIVVAPVGFPPPASALRAIEASGGVPTAQGDSKGFDGPPVMIAVENRDVESVATALATREALFTVAFHSAEPNSESSQRVIAIAPESINAFSRLTESAWHGNRRGVTTRRVSHDASRFDQALSPSQLAGFYGRILKRDKVRGDFFTAEDFLPEDSQEGLGSIARKGFTLLPIADREVEGLDAFRAGDEVTILLRGVFHNRLTEKLAPDAGVASSTIVADSVRIIRGSVGGRSVLEISNDQLARFQAAIARSLTDRDDFENRSHLVAVGVKSSDQSDEQEVGSEISGFDPLQDVRTTELIIGGKRSVEVFAGGDR